MLDGELAKPTSAPLTGKPMSNVPEKQGRASDAYKQDFGSMLRGKPMLQMAWHDYRPDAGSGRYGTELDASLSWPVAKGTTLMAKVADYRADGLGSDARKWWLQMEWKGSAKP